MASLLQQNQIDLTDRLIKDTFISLFEEKGLDKISVSEICKVSGVSRSAFYLHFDDKYAVMESIQDEMLNGVKDLNKSLNVVSLSDTDLSIPAWIKTANYILDNKKYFRPLLIAPGDPFFIRKWSSAMQEDYKRRLQIDHVLPDKHADFLLYSMATAVIGMYEYLFLHEDEITPEEIAHNGTRLLWQSFYKKN